MISWREGHLFRLEPCTTTYAIGLDVWHCHFCPHPICALHCSTVRFCSSQKFPLAGGGCSRALHHYHSRLSNITAIRLSRTLNTMSPPLSFDFYRRYYSGISLERLRKIVINLSRGIRSPSRDFIPGPPEAGVLMTLPRHSVKVVVVRSNCPCITYVLCSPPFALPAGQYCELQSHRPLHFCVCLLRIAPYSVRIYLSASLSFR
jgi:hypothetical protein